MIFLNTILDVAEESHKMKKFEYRCNRCLIIEDRWLFNSEKPTNSIPCHKCGELAIRLPLEKWKDNVFNDFVKKTK
jgi:hypothetical protein